MIINDSRFGLDKDLNPLLKEWCFKFKDWYIRHPGQSLYHKDKYPWVKKTNEEVWEEFLKLYINEDKGKMEQLVR